MLTGLGKEVGHGLEKFGTTTRTPCMTSLRQGEVIFTEIAFSGDPGRKRRPAVVISIDEFNRAGTKLSSPRLRVISRRPIGTETCC